MAIGYHEPPEVLSPRVRDLHRALASLYEEIEAIDWYNQRIEQTNDEELKRILVHNQTEEMEHAAMALEWLRRKMPAFDAPLRTYLFTEQPIVALEEEVTADAEAAPEGEPATPAAGTGDLHIRTL